MNRATSSEDGKLTATQLKSALTSRPSEATVKRMWEGVESLRHGPRPARAYRWTVAIAASAVLITAIAALLFFHREGADVLLLANRSAMPEKVFTPRATRFEFVDGSQIQTRPRTRFDVVMNRRDAIEFALRVGALSVQVTPGGPRKWTIHCGDVDVMVVGTAFDVVRTPQDVTVKVHRGKVCIKGAQVPDGIQMLTADMQIRVPHGASRTATPLATTAATPSSSSVEVPLPAAESKPIGAVDAHMEGSQQKQLHGRDAVMSPGSTQVAGTGAGADKTDVSTLVKAGDAPKSVAPVSSLPGDMPTWKKLAQSQEFNAAYMALPEFTFSSLGSTVWTPDDLFLLSDIARITGHSREASFALRALIERYPDNPRAGVAAYTLARVTTESLQQPGQGAVYYEQALELGISKPLRETALMRLIQAYRHSSPAKAQYYRDIYLAEYPAGRYREEINP